MNDLNPYATTEVFFEPPPPEAFWYTEGLAVYARNGAVLPAIDLETGEEGEELVAVTRSIRKVSWVNFIGFPILILFYILRKIYDEPLKGPGLIWILILSCSTIAFRFFIQKFWPKLKPKIMEVQYFRNGKTVRKEKIRQWLLAVLAILSFCVLVSTAPLYVWYGEPKLISLAVLGLGGIIATGVYGYLHRSKIHLSAGPDDWIRFGNVSQIATSKLRKIETGRGI